MDKKTNLKTWVVMAVLLVGMAPAIATGGTIYIDAGASGANDGTSWVDAYNYLQDALAVAQDGNDIWVAEGTYKPDVNSAKPGGTGDDTAAFQLINGVAIYGGFPSGGGQWEERDPNAHKAMLSGDLNGDDIPTSPYNNGDNSYDVVTGWETDANAVLDGFTISAGYDSGMYNEWYSSPTVTNCAFSGNYGSGMYNDSNSSPTVTNCTFSGNSAEWSGGGIYNYESSPTVTNCTFSRNYDSGMYNDSYSSPTVTNCTFSGNSTEWDGGGMYNYESSPTVTNCIFSGNTAIEWGGGMCNDESSLTVTDCTFSGNSADLWDGGGMYNFYSSLMVTNCTFSGNSADYGGGMCNDESSPTVTNCTFSGNSADYGGGMYNGWDSNPNITNCILWGNAADTNGAEVALTDPNWPSTLTISYSDVEGGLAGLYIEPNCSVIWGLGNIDADPCFVETGYWDANGVWVDGDYHLASEGWRWDVQRKVWTWDDVTSRCIDAGNPGCMLGEELLSVPRDPNNKWGQNLRINMGTFGGTAEASMPPYDWAILSNFTNDGKVDLNDLAAFVDYWLDSGECIPSDLNHNQFVDFVDFAPLAQDWFLETNWYTP